MMRIRSPMMMRAAVVCPTTSTAMLTDAVLFSHQSHRSMMVHLHGQEAATTAASIAARPRSATQLSAKASTSSTQRTANMAGSRMHQATGERPPDPNQLLSQEEHDRQVERLIEWWQQDNKQQVLCLSGAGLSTESGIPDYRGHKGSYHRGHKPMIHDQFVKSAYQRQRYWGRGMVGWRDFYKTSPNAGHFALAELEKMGKLGVQFEDQAIFYEDGEDDLEWAFTSGQRSVAVISQNVDTLHRRAGSKDILELHGRLDQIKCMQCGSTEDRGLFQNELEELNKEWLEVALEATNRDEDIRPDGDTALQTESYENVQVPACKSCEGFLKPDVVFFGDSVPKSRVDQCRAAVGNADGLLVVGSSLAVHSAFRHVRAASKLGIPVAILNVGETRAEKEKLPGILKIEAPAGSTLAQVAKHFSKSRTSNSIREQQDDNDEVMTASQS